MANNDPFMGLYHRALMYQQARRIFAGRVFMLAAFFVLMAAVQWIPLLLIESLKRSMAEHYYISHIVFFCALLTVTVFILFERVRFIVPLNWILTLFIVECAIWGLARAVAASQINQFGYSFMAVTVVVVLTIVIGGCIPYDLTLDVVFLFIGSILLFMGTMFFIMIHIITAEPYAAYIYVAFAVSIILVFLVYHSQTILGGRFAEIRIADYLLAALMIFHDFVMLFVLTFYLASNIATNQPRN